MTPRERIIATLEHRAPDRVPLDIGGTESSGLTAIAYNRLRPLLKLPPRAPQIFDVYQQLAKIPDDLRAVLEVDTVPLLIEPRRWRQFTLSDGSPCEIPEKWNPLPDDGYLVVRNEQGRIIARMPADGLYFESVNPPLAQVSSPAELGRHKEVIESYDWPPFADESLEQIAARAKQLFEQTDLCVVANLQLHLLAAGQMLRGYENFVIDLLVNKPLAHALLEMLTDAYIRRCRQYLGRCGRYIQVVLVNDDLGTQTGPMISPASYKEMIFPYQKRLFGFIKRNTDAHLLFHSCGSVYRFIPDLIEAGVDALNPVQVSAADMDTKRLKRQFGKDICFWGGGCDTQHILNAGTPRQIEQEVARRIDDLSAGGGFIFTQVHNVQPDVPPQNFMAMIEAFRKYR